MLPVSLLFILYIISAEGFTQLSNDNYLINTSKCTIPDIPSFLPNFTMYLKRAPIPCTTFNPLPTYTSIENDIPWLHVRNEVLTQYFPSTFNISCCFSYIFRNGSEELPDVGVVTSSCFKFQHKVALYHDTVWVSCSKSEDFQDQVRGFPIASIYDNIHQVVKLHNNIRDKTEKLKKSARAKPISVLMVVIDSVSRLNFIRTMPKTRHFVMENNFYEFKGYNKVADNTFPNAMAFLTGMNLEQSLRYCKPTEINGLNNCPFIWYKYRDLGYATAYAEDWAEIATFNYLKKGFKEIPTDYYFKPYMDATRYLIPRIQDTMPFCAGPESQGDRILNLSYDFATTLKDLPSFGVFWMNTFSHNVITTPKTMDSNVRHFFKKLKISGVLNESIVILLSDHGIRFSQINTTPRGFYELRLPMHYISLPPWFKEVYPVETKNLKENTDKLTSNYDLYMTLQHILKLSGTNYTMNPSLACPDCKSFFENIPVERSCSEAGIPEKWCTCNANETTINNYINS